ncbi:hypothetical protein GGF31_007964 [Allomyces arbusculus]|nr:hypothetical protein GGF31_007964 [Allomyces arbusculus]
MDATTSAGDPAVRAAGSASTTTLDAPAPVSSPSSPASPWKHLLTLAAVVQSVVLFALEATIGFLVIPLPANDTPTARLRGIPVYVVVFACAQLFAMLVAHDAVAHENALQLVTLVIFHACTCIYAVFQATTQLTAANVAMVVRPVGAEFGLSPVQAAVVRGFALAMPILMLYFWVVVTALAVLLYREFGFRVYKRMGADPIVQHAYRSYLILASVLQLNAFFGGALALVYLALVDHLDVALAVGLIVAVFVMLPSTYFGAHRESRWLMGLSILTLAATSAIVGVMVARIVDVHHQERNVALASTARFLLFFASITLMLCAATGILLVHVTRQFGKGLREAFKSGTERTSDAAVAAAVNAAAASAAPEQQMGTRERIVITTAPHNETAPHVSVHDVLPSPSGAPKTVPELAAHAAGTPGHNDGNLAASASTSASATPVVESGPALDSPADSSSQYLQVVAAVDDEEYEGEVGTTSRSQLSGEPGTDPRHAHVSLVLVGGSTTRSSLVDSAICRGRSPARDPGLLAPAPPSRAPSSTSMTRLVPVPAADDTAPAPPPPPYSTYDPSLRSARTLSPPDTRALSRSGSPSPSSSATSRRRRGRARGRQGEMLYLYDNELASLDPLSALPCLDQLYVQGNRLTSLDPLSGMAYLTIIDASGNSIFCISNLRLPSLKELHLDRQVPAPEGLFDARSPMSWTLDVVAGTNELPELAVLTLSHTRLGIMDGFAEFCALEVLNVSDCGIHDYSVRKIILLRAVDLTQNPVMNTSARLRDKIILGHPFLESLNGKEISQIERQFLFNWVHRKDAKRRAQRADRVDSSDGAADPSRPPSLDTSKVPTLPPIRSSAKAISTRQDSGGRGSTRGTLLSSFDK